MNGLVDFFTGPDWRWNWFDFLVVGLQCFEQARSYKLYSKRLKKEVKRAKSPAFSRLAWSSGRRSLFPAGALNCRPALVVG